MKLISKNQGTITLSDISSNDVEVLEALGASRNNTREDGTEVWNIGLSILTSAGVIKAYVSADPTIPGICTMLRPAGGNGEIDLAFAYVVEDPDCASRSDKERPVDVVIRTYGDPYNEDCTSKAVLRREAVADALKLEY